jgi:hypothetical protein
MVVATDLANGKSTNCGCLRMARFRAAATVANTRHGLSHIAPEYTIWVDMRRRCYQPQRPDYRNYGARGITVCNRWKNDFAAFYADMGPRPPKYTLERRDNNGPYSPSNCFWASKKAQDGNKRTSRLIRLGSETMTVAAAERQLGVRKNFLLQRLKRGWSLEKAVNTPPLGRGRSSRRRSAVRECGEE